MECNRWGYCPFPRLDITLVWEGAPRYCEGHESEATERVAICECGAVVIFLLLIEDK